MNLFLILRLKLIISTDSLTNNVQQFPRITPYLPMSILQQMKLTNINFDEQLISKLIVVLNPNKAHGHDGLSICMLQMGSDSISKPLSIIFRSCLKAGYFPAAWKKANVVPVHKKGNKQILNNYRPVSLHLFVVNCLRKFLIQFFNT